MQRRYISLIEITISTAIGFGLSYLCAAIVFPLFGFPVTSRQNLSITGIFTLLSLVRGYGVRRLFNWLHVTGILS